MRALLDTNVVLDVMLNRQPWVQTASHIWQAVDDDKFTGYLSAYTLMDVFYIARKVSGREKAVTAVKLCLEAFKICPVNQQILTEALNLTNPDFENNVQVAGAVYTGIHCIITRDLAGFTDVNIPITTPEEFVNTYLSL